MILRLAQQIFQSRADRDGIIYEGGFGPRNVGEPGDVDTSTQFRIMSMTKMVATTVALQQMEKGTLDLDAPVETYCPEFAEIQVLEGLEAVRRRFVRSWSEVQQEIEAETKAREAV